MKFRKKPVIIEAIRWVYSSMDASQNNFDEIKLFAGDSVYIQPFEGLMVRTLEGVHKASNGDWIIKGVKREFYPCKPDIFEMTYEPVQDAKSKD